MTDLDAEAAPTIDPVTVDAPAGRGRYYVGDRLPGALTLTDFAAVLGYSIWHMSKLKKSGTLRIFEVVPHVGGQTLYSGAKIRAWLDGTGSFDLAPSRSFGRALRAK